VAYDAVDSVVGLARTLRAAGVPASPDRVHAAVRAVPLLDPASREDVYWATRLTLCGSREDLDRHDAVFDAYFGDRPTAAVRRPRVRRPALQLVAGLGGDGPEEGSEPASARSVASDVE
jgi:uncharacterized protein